MATMVDSGLKPERIKFDLQNIQKNFRISLSKRTISMGRDYYGGGSSATAWVGGGATAMVNVGQWVQGVQGPQGMPGPVGQQIIPQQFEEWQTMPVHAVITEEMIEQQEPIGRIRGILQRYLRI